MNNDRVESVKMFNQYHVEVRSKIDGLVKQVLFISAGIQAITIGAFFSSSPPVLPADAIGILKFGWLSLSISVVLALSFMLGQVLAMYWVGRRFKRKIQTYEVGAEPLEAPWALQAFNWVVGIGAFLSCAGGSLALSLAAMQLTGGFDGA